MKFKEFVEIKNSDFVKIDIKYATTDNFTKQIIYEKLNKAYLHPIAFNKFEKAIDCLKKFNNENNRDLKFIIFDALRSRKAQYKLFSFVKGTAQEIYIANPDKGSIHNYGFAIDLSLIDENSCELDMGTPFDDFSELSQPQLQEKFLSEGLLKPYQLESRKILSQIMTEAGFNSIPHEWWHYEALDRASVRDLYSIFENEEQE